MTRIVKLKPITEAKEQILFVTWLTKKGVRVSASANGGSRHLFEAVKLKRMGVSKGYPDIFIPMPTQKYHGFFIEMKRSDGGKISPEQVEWLDYLRSQSYFAEVACGFDEARDMFEQYIKDYPKAA